MTAMQYTMKDSGVPWIGEIPEHWETIRMKFSSWLKGRIGWQGLKSTEYTDKGPFLITGTDFQYGKINWNSCAHITEERFAEDSDIHIQEGDLLITKDGTIGKVAIAKDCPEQASLNSGVMLIRNTKSVKYKDGYLYYTLLSDIFFLWYDYTQNGASTIKHLYQEQFYNFTFCLPPLPEQEAIAAYLDEKCGAIDEIIAEAKATIEEYKAWKGSVIFEAVTKGLDPNAEMKDSGVEWIGSVPKGWRTNKVRSCAIFLNGDRSENYPKPEEFVDYGVPFISSYNIEYDVLDVSIHPKFITEQKYNALRGAKLSINDIVFCLRGSIGKCAINLTETQGALASSLVVIRCTGMSSKFLLYVLLSQIATVQTEICMNGTCAANLSAENVAGYIIPVPSTEEQNAIVIFLDRQCSAIDAIIGEKQTLIDDLDAYKKSLIFETVTGKRRVV